MHLLTVQMVSCPVCRGKLELEAAGVRCPAGHSFDFARQGYVNLVTNMPSVRIR
jgi:23S rRNA (guanine745-N1)-methyltransferase